MFTQEKLINAGELEVNNFFFFLAAMMLVQPVRSLAINMTIHLGSVSAKEFLQLLINQ